MNKQSEIILTLSNVDPIDLYGQANSKLNILKEAYPDVIITSRGQQLKLMGEKKKAQELKSKIESIVRVIQNKQSITEHQVKDIALGEQADPTVLEFKSFETIVHGKDGKPIRARTPNQKKLVDLVGKNDIVFAIGPAGTGKTYTAVALAVRALKNRSVKKIILSRPAVEAGENLGFLPGDLKDKVDPYLRPLYDALEDMIPGEKLMKFMSERTIEVAPLAYMRGRTLDNAFIILDEAQNTTAAQIKLFLTRLGPSAKCIITGDLSQVDLPRNQTSGLRIATKILKSISGIGTVYLTADDVVRHRLVKEIIKAYDRYAEQRFEERKRKEEEE